jgi:hypothetical protein
VRKARQWFRRCVWAQHSAFEPCSLLLIALQDVPNIRVSDLPKVLRPRGSLGVSAASARIQHHEEQQAAQESARLIGEHVVAPCFPRGVVILFALSPARERVNRGRSRLSSDRKRTGAAAFESYDDVRHVERSF